MVEYTYVKLDRRLAEITSSDLDEQNEPMMLASLSRGTEGQTWLEVATLDCAIVLGSAGAGKTRELLELAKELRAAGTPAFVFRIEALCRLPAEESFSPHDQASPAAFARWKEKRGPAVALLDALDEARLPDARNTSALADALVRLSRSVGSSGKGLRVIISSRASEWQGDNDLRAIEIAIKGLRVSDPSEEADISVKTLRLLPLRRPDVMKIAEHRGVNPDQFTAAIDKAKAANLVSQPFDVQLLLDLWFEAVGEGKDPASIFSSRLRVYEDIVRFRLRSESGQERRSNLDPLLGRQACEKLAAISVLSDVQDFTIEPDKPLTIHALSALSSDADRWTEVDVRQLLSHGLFQPSVSGRVRFAHRELRDYLAACFFRWAICQNAGSMDVVQPLLAEGLGYTDIPQSTEHVLGWLASVDPVARRVVTNMRPSLLIETGDPTRLTLDEKSRAIASHVAAYRERLYRGEWFYQEDLREFVTPDLAPAISEQLAIATSSEIRELLVEMIRFGQMTSLAAELRTIACNQAEGLRVRAEACLALAEFNDFSFAHDVLVAALQSSAPQHEETQSAPSWNLFVASAMRYVLPAGVSLLDEIALVDRFRREAKNYASATSMLLEGLVAELPLDKLLDWLQIFLRFARASRSSERDMMPTILPRFRMLRAPICHALDRLLQHGSDLLEKEVLLEAVEFAFGVNGRQSYSLRETGFEKLATTLRPMNDLKLDLILMRLALFETTQSEWYIARKAIGPLQVDRNDKPIEVFNVSDIERLGDLMAEGDAPRRRDLYFACARIVYDEIQKPAERNRAYAILRNLARKHGSRDLKRAYGPLAPIRGLRRHQFRYRDWYRVKGWFHARADAVIGAYWKWHNWTKFLRDFSSLSQGRKPGYLGWAANRSPNDLGPDVIEAIRKRYGPLIAGLFASGFKRYWRENGIIYSAQRDYQVMIGLTGLALQSPGDLAGLSDELVERAFTYGFCNMNGFPDWMPVLIALKPEIFVTVTTAALTQDIASSSNEKFSSDGFSRIAYSSAAIRELVAAPLFQLLQTTGIPENRRDLEMALMIIARSHAVPTAQLSPFLRRQFTDLVTSFKFAEAWLWLDALCAIDPPNAWSTWISTFGEVWTSSSASLFKHFLGREGLSSSRAEEHVEERDALAADALTLAHLTKAAYLIWPPSKDPVHEDAYSPGIDEKATSRRAYYLNALVALGNEDALLAIDRLASDPALRLHRDTFLYQRDKMVRASLRRPSLTVADSISFVNVFTKPPASVPEFRALVKRQIIALLEKLHHSDDDESFVFRDNRATEDDLRNWLSARMREIGSSHYEVIREQEVAVENRPDLRVHSRNPEFGLISVEIKLADADHWSGDTLVNKIETQLANQYMYENGSHTGFYLLANAAKPLKNEIDLKTGGVKRKAFAKKVAGESVNFAELIALCAARAATVTAGLGGNKVVDVIAVDLSKR
ncbi:NACHT domain-containing protein [Rhizobium leguminosarum]|uniref:NACHT domain-containing protein n=1 Tax=Rhizobium leguminosarum TaxID=384 RepID=UPI003F96D77E